MSRAYHKVIFTRFRSPAAGLFVCALVMLHGVGVWADGCFVWQKGADIVEPSQKAIIAHIEDSQTMILQVKYQGPAQDFAWIVPLPGKPDVSVIKPEDNPFEEISRYTQVRDRYRYGRKLMDDEQIGGGVTVLERKVVGPYDIAVLAAEEADALLQWLNKHGFAFPGSRQDVLAHYTRKKWFYVAMRIDPDQLQNDDIGKLKTGELQAIRFKFKTQQAVYPLKISSVNAGETTLLLYLLGEQPLVPVNGLGKKELKTNTILFDVDPGISGRVTDPKYGTDPAVPGEYLPKTWKTIGQKPAKELYLCKYRTVMAAAEMTDDIAFEPFKPVAYFTRIFENKALSACDRFFALKILCSHDAAYKSKRSAMKKEVAEEDTRLERQSIENQRKMLREYMASENPDMRCLVAWHARATEDMLLGLARDPAEKVRKALFSKPEIPDSVLEILAGDESESIRLAVARCSKIPEGALRALAKDKSPYVRLAVASRQNLPELLIRTLAADSEPDVRGQIAIRNDIPKEVLFVLADDPDPAVRLVLLKNSITPEETQLRLIARDGDADLRRGIARTNSHIPPDALLLLARDRDLGVRQALAQNTDLTPAVKTILMKDADQKVRRFMYNRQDMTDETRLQFASDEDPWLRSAVAQNHKATPEILARLCKDPVSEVRNAALRNPNTPTKVAIEYARNELKNGYDLAMHANRSDWLRGFAREPDLRRGLAHNKHLPADLFVDLAKDPDPAIRKAIAKREDATPEALRELADDKDMDILIEVARHPNTPGDVLKKLVVSEDAGIRKWVAGNRRAPEAILRQLAEDTDINVVDSVADNPNTPADVLGTLAEKGESCRLSIARNPGAPADLLRRFADNGDSNMRRHVAANPGTPVDVLRTLATDTSWFVRWQVAGNRSAPDDILQMLAGDNDSRISQAASITQTLKKQQSRTDQP
ncbi:MAG: DUF2330 domain-containing protein [Lentisphaeria bacterium]|nr:DUF2330 domain-containing protein [Lentisphaeria bacterium]